MPRPIIGITTRQTHSGSGWQAFALLRAYVDAVTEAGGVPLLIPASLPVEHLPTLLQRLDGVLLSGGGDIDLRFAPGQPHPAINEVDPERDELELALARAALHHSKPLLGICRGCQVLNVAFGGTLYTHIPDQLPGALQHTHPDSERRRLVHPVHIHPATRLAAIIGMEQLEVNSLHHQGVERLGQGLQASAHSPDGLIEAIEHTDHPFLIGVQWHPEWLTDQLPLRRLFRALVAVAEHR